METTIRQHMNPGEVVMEHNARDDILAENEKHIDTEHGTHLVWKEETIEEAYQKVFGEAIEKYNQKQKRRDRQITLESYMDTVMNDTRGKRKSTRKNGKKIVDAESQTGKRIVYENIVSVGSSDKIRGADGRVEYVEYTKEQMKERHPIMMFGLHEKRMMELPFIVSKNACQRYADEFEKRNQQLHLLRCDFHADEGYWNRKNVWEWGIPHIHCVWIPFSDGYQRGLEVQQSISKALSKMGYTDGIDEESGRFVTAYEKWNKTEQQAMEQYVMEEYERYCQKHPQWYAEHGDLQIVHPDTGLDNVENLSPENYKRLQELEKDIEDADEELRRVRKEINDVKTTAASAKAEVESKMEEFTVALLNILKDDDEETREEWMRNHFVNVNGQRISINERYLADVSVLGSSKKIRADEAKKDIINRLDQILKTEGQFNIDHAIDITSQFTTQPSAGF